MLTLPCLAGHSVQAVLKLADPSLVSGIQVALTLRQAPSTFTSLSQSNLLLSSTSWMRAR